MTSPVLTTSVSQAAGIVNHMIERISTDAGTPEDQNFVVGFTPRVVRFVNLTDRITLEWYEGMAANSAIRTVAAGTRTLDVSSGITVTSADSASTTDLQGTTVQGSVQSKKVVQIKAADIPASKVCTLECIG